MAETPVLDVGGLTVRFPNRNDGLTAVDGISFRIERGECLGLVGESGSGKTMAALSIPRLVPQPGRVECGHVRLSGEDIDGLPERAMRKIRGRRIGMIFQEPMSSLNPTMTIGDQIAEPLILHTEFGMQERGNRVMELLERVRMPDPASVISAYPHQLSGGMQQRAMIAMALACGPDLLIADEPTTALDVTVQAEILGLINEMRRDLGMAVLFISHNIAVVSAVADRIAVMKDGRIVEEGKAADVVASPTSDYGKALLAAVPRLGAGPHPGRTAVAEDAAELITAKSLSKSYPGRGGLFGGGERKQALMPVDLSIRAGETLALVGASGCGKTTLSRCLMRLIDADGGDVLLDGREAGPDSRDLRRSVQMVFQDPYDSLNPRWTVGAILREPLRIHRIGTAGEQEQAVADALERVELSPEDAQRYPHQFSGGQRQRIAIARALMLRPRLLVADEPVSALDVSVQARILDLLVDLQREFGLAILLVSHDIAVVERLADRVAVMEDGAIVETGPTADLLAHPRSEAARRLLAAVPRLPERAA
jgi:peptide/nickel transport system ATP-binding protein